MRLPLRVPGARSHLAIAALTALVAASGLAEPAPPVLWRSTALVTTASSISDLPGGRFVDFGNVFARTGGEVVFWAKLAGREEKRSWALFSLRAGALRTILEEGEEVTSRYSAEPGRKFHVHATGIWHPVTVMHNGRWLAFTSSSGALGREAGVYGWDGERIQPLILPGQSIDIGGRSATITSAAVPVASPTGELLISLGTAKPLKAWMTAVYDGKTLRALLPESGGEKPTDLMWTNVRLLANGECIVLANAGERNREALVLITAEGTRRLLAAGDPFPLDSTRRIRWIQLLFAQSATRYVTLLTSDDGTSRHFLHDGAKVFSLSPPETQGVERWGFGLQQGDFLLGDAPLFLYKGEVDFSTYSKLDPRGTQVYLFDGGAVRRLTDSRVVGAGAAPLTRIARLLDGAYPGALVNANLAGTGPVKPPDLWPLYYLDARDLAAGLQPVPQLELEGGRRIGLDAVRAWPSATTAIAVVAGEGIYRLEESAVPAP